jgi:hypothetical protein
VTWANAFGCWGGIGGGCVRIDPSLVLTSNWGRFVHARPLACPGLGLLVGNVLGSARLGRRSFGAGT